MTRTIWIAVFALGAALTPALAVAAGGCGHDEAKLSCADGHVYDAATGRCIKATS